MADLSVAVIGASQDRTKFGNKAVRAFVDAGYEVFPVNPREESIEGLRAYPTLEAIVAPVDVVSLYVRPAVGLALLPAIAAKGPRQLWLNPGTESAALLDAAADLQVPTVLGCSIIALGRNPAQFPDA